jgi:UDPglucose--hexose-1-phosphate uridylyltransferase
MPELRQNMATKEWVIIATERARRPSDFVQPSRTLTEARPEWDAACPFCPGNEENDLEVMRIPSHGPWQVRIVGNKYPALQRYGERMRTFDGVHRQISGVGYHEVVIEAARHNTCAALETPDEVALTLEAFKIRNKEIAQDPRIEQIICFKNHGERAGTSLAHPHAQMVALPIVPFAIRTRIEEARRYFDDTGQCAFCHMLSEEMKARSRIVAENDSFVAFVLYAAFSPFHIWIMPRHHKSSFLHASAQELADLGVILRQVLRKYYLGLRDPDYNFVIRTAPLHDPGDDYLHWYVTLVARVTSTAGFEMGSGMYINTTLPEHSAEFLRSVTAD